MLWLIISRRIPQLGLVGTLAKLSVPLPHRSLMETSMLMTFSVATGWETEIFRRPCWVPAQKPVAALRRRHLQKHFHRRSAGGEGRAEGYIHDW